MRRVAAAGVILSIVCALSACGGGSGSGVSEGDAKEAFVLSMVSVLSASIGLAFGQDVPGATLEEETQNLVLDDFRLDEFFGADSELAYKSVSGTVANEEDAMVADLILEGGPVETIGFRLTGEQLQSAGGFSTTITINGKEVSLEITEADLQGE